MPPSASINPSVLLITSRAHFDAADVRASTADAMVVQLTAGDPLLQTVLAVFTMPAALALAAQLSSG